MPRRPRRQPLAPHRAKRLLVVAGLPKSVSNRARAELEGRFLNCDVICPPAQSKDGGVYSSQYVETLVNSVSQFAIRRRCSGQPAVAPEALVLLYVPAQDDEQVLRAFDFSVFPYSLSDLASWDESGRMSRHDPNLVVQALLESTQRAMDLMRVVLERTWSARAQDALLLPPNNFHVDRERRVSDLFRELRTGRREWEDRFAEVLTRRLSSEHLVPLHGGMVQTCPIDARALVFFRPHAAEFHGPVREAGDMPSPNSEIHALRALYRFGGAIPIGFHHDVQFTKPATDMGGLIMECSEQGEIRCSGSHANVYPNDRVRPAKAT